MIFLSTIVQVLTYFCEAVIPDKGQSTVPAAVLEHSEPGGAGIAQTLGTSNKAVNIARAIIPWNVQR